MREGLSWAVSPKINLALLGLKATVGQGGVNAFHV